MTTEQEYKYQNQTLIKNLENVIKNERLLREIGHLIIYDNSIQEISKKIAELLCKHLSVDRVLIHDFKNSRPNFIAEFSDAKIFDNHDENSVKNIEQFIQFHVNFYKKNSEKQIFSAEDISSDARFDAIRDLVLKYSISSELVAITTFDENPNGGIYIQKSTKRLFNENEVELIEIVGEQISMAIERSYSIEKVMVTNHELLQKTLELKDAIKKEKELRKVQSEFVALVSHEFKTPLQIIDSTREIIVRKIKSANYDSLEKYLNKIKNGVHRMNGLINSTLNLAKIESDGNIKTEKSKFNLKDLIADVVEKNASLAINKNIEIVIKVDEIEGLFDGDSRLLEHCFNNIISNAIKYSKESGVVKIIGKSSDNAIAIRIIDSGIGIPDEDMKNIGKKFFRAKNTLFVAGTGIGLYLTKYFVELHSGKLIIKSKISVGTSITVILPKI
jgi:signal transduction histidine kinase